MITGMKDVANRPKPTWRFSKCQVFIFESLQQLAGQAYVFLLHPFHTSRHITRKPGFTTQPHQTNNCLLMQITDIKRTVNCAEALEQPDPLPVGI